MHRLTKPAICLAAGTTAIIAAATLAAGTASAAPRVNHHGTSAARAATTAIDICIDPTADNEGDKCCDGKGTAVLNVLGEGLICSTLLNAEPGYATASAADINVETKVDTTNNMLGQLIPLANNLGY